LFNSEKRLTLNIWRDRSYLVLFWRSVFGYGGRLHATLSLAFMKANSYIRGVLPSVCELEGEGHWASPYVQKKCGKLELLLMTKEKIFHLLELSVGMKLVIEIGVVLGVLYVTNCGEWQIGLSSNDLCVFAGGGFRSLPI